MTLLPRTLVVPLFGLAAGCAASASNTAGTQPPAQRSVDRPQQPAAVASPTFVNPIAEGADPWVMKHDGSYYFCQSEGDQGITVWKSDRLTDKGVKRVVWRPDRGRWNSHQVWAPELHFIRGRWYIHYAASDGKNENHRAGVLEAETDDPQGPYVDRGMLYTGDDVAGQTHNRWAIDATPFEHAGRLYVIWSGWPGTGDVQYLYIARMSDPCTIATNRVKLCENDTHLWERVGETLEGRGLQEGPQVFRRNGKIFLMYSCSGSWEPTYKLGLLYMDEAADPMDPQSWTKLDRPAFQRTQQVWGIGHACVTRSPDDAEDWLVYHSKVSLEPGWHRAVSLQPFTWRADGLPDFGLPLPPGEPIPAPSGETGPQPCGTFSETFTTNWDAWTYYGYNRFIRVEGETLSLGGHPRWGLINQYRAGEKALMRGCEWADLSVSVRLRIEAGERDAGVLFRVSNPALGYDAQRGYFAGLIAGTDKVVLGATDGTRWQEIALVDHPVQPQRWYTLRVQARGEVIEVYVDDTLAIRAADSRYARGLVGVRVVDTHALFDDVEVRGLVDARGRRMP